MLEYESFETGSRGLPHFYELGVVHLALGLATFRNPHTLMAQEHTIAFKNGPENFLSFLVKKERYINDERSYHRHAFLHKHSLVTRIGYSDNSPNYYPLMGYYHQLNDENLLLYKLKYG